MGRAVRSFALVLAVSAAGGCGGGPSPAPVAEAARAEATHEVVFNAFSYAERPLARRTPDGILRSGGRVRVLAFEGPLALVETQDDGVLWTAAAALRPLSD
ncbi:MAG: hypothetical protein ACYTG6_07810 [Planctomycetota bacterium]|jgi:hypothetical protein